jgi:hypothetical protein
MGVQAFHPQLAVEDLDEDNVCRFPGTAEVQLNSMSICPQVEIAGDNFRSLIDTDRIEIAAFGADALLQVSLTMPAGLVVIGRCTNQKNPPRNLCWRIPAGLSIRRCPDRAASR